MFINYILINVSTYISIGLAGVEPLKSTILCGFILDLSIIAILMFP